MGEVLEKLFSGIETVATPKRAPKSELEQMLTEACYLNEKIDRLTEQLRGMKLKIADQAVFEGESKTATVAGRDVIAKVQLRFTRKYDQAKLESLRMNISDGTFFKLFDWEYTPKRNVESIAEALNVEISKYCEIKKAAPSVTFTIIKEGGPDAA